MGKKTVKVVELTHEQMMQKAEDDFLADWDRTQDCIQPFPTRSYVNGELVRLGNLQNVVILKRILDGKAYVLKCDWQGNRNDNATIQYRCVWWFEVQKLIDTNSQAPLMSNYRQFPAIASDIESLTFRMLHGGIVCDPKYQRSYVWSEENKDALIASIFERLDIGSFLLISHSGYLHKGDESLKEYRALDGRTVHVKRCDDYTSAVIDGQQRLTTIVDFLLDVRPYKGLYFSQLCYRDQYEFRSASVQIRLIKEEQVTEKDVVRMFLQSNRGVPQSAEHLKYVQALYDGMSDK